ncbi:MAG: lytic murein transglycosylase [Gammaproteobacteria bacterium]|nr:lytic murein transglycosylase [Gammaproteobacteria bacterium]
MKKYNWLINLILSAFVCASPCLKADKLSVQRALYLQAEKMLRDKNEAGFLATSAALVDYPLYPYLRYQWLKEKLTDNGQITSFLSTYQDTRYAGLLRGKWLDYLASKAQWSEFLKYYQIDEKSADDCRYQWAKHQTGNREAALVEGKRLWLEGKEADKNCQPLFAALEKSAHINQDLIWQRFEAAINANRTLTAQSALALLKGELKTKANTWLLLYNNPGLINQPLYWREKNEENGRLFAHTVKRLASNDLEKAIGAWENSKQNFPLNVTISDSVARKLGTSLLAKKDSRSYSYLILTKNPEADERINKVRAGLLEQNWQHIDTALAGLSPDQRQLPQWQYWHARMLEQTGRDTQAQAAYKALANDRSYYGFNAADKINSPYHIPDTPLIVSDEAIASLAGQPDFLAARELELTGNSLESRRQWHHAIKKLPKEKLAVAAKLAQQWGWNPLAIITLVKADYWDDLSIRFPIAYQSEIDQGATSNKVDSAILFGLMRQESMLDKEAVSPVGARGLMQIMPETAATIAKDLQSPLISMNDLFKPEVNIRFGSYYFSDMLQKVGGHVALAAGAYNAGLHRVRKWLPSVAPVPADIWIETIPFKETRKYVSSALGYAIIYQQRLKKNGLRLKTLMREVSPG